MARVKTGTLSCSAGRWRTSSASSPAAPRSLQVIARGGQRGTRGRQGEPAAPWDQRGADPPRPKRPRQQQAAAGFFQWLLSSSGGGGLPFPGRWLRQRRASSIAAPAGTFLLFPWLASAVPNADFWSAFLYTLGSCGFLFVDVQEFFTFDGAVLRLNISLSAIGSTFYVIGSVVRAGSSLLRVLDAVGHSPGHMV